MNTENLKPPRREVAQEFYTNIIELGKMARAQMLAEMRNGDRPFDITGIREMEENIKVCEHELEKFK
jgi:hypothetical protein